MEFNPKWDVYGLNRTVDPVYRTFVVTKTTRAMDMKIFSNLRIALRNPQGAYVRLKTIKDTWAFSACINFSKRTRRDNIRMWNDIANVLRRSGVLEVKIW